MISAQSIIKTKDWSFFIIFFAHMVKVRSKGALFTMNTVHKNKVLS